MISRKRVIGFYLTLFGLGLVIGFIQILPIHWDVILIFEITSIVMIAALFTLLPMIYAVNRWDKLYRVIYPIYETEGFSDYFFETALQYGQTITKTRMRTSYYVDLLVYYHSAEKYEDSVKAFVAIDTAYIASIKDSCNPSSRKIVMTFFNNGLYTCLKTGRLEDAKRLYRDGYTYLKKYEHSVAVMDTLAEYHFQIKEYDKSIYYDEKILAKGTATLDVANYATERLRMAREKIC